MSVTPETALNEPRTEDDADALGKKQKSPLVSGIELKTLPRTSSGPQQKTVEFRIQLAVSKLQDAQELCSADYELYLRFDAPTEHHDPSAPPGAQQFDLEALPPDLVPSPSFHRAESVEEVERHCQLDRRGGKIYLFYNWLVTVREPFGLRRFPFDSQELTVRLELGFPARLQRARELAPWNPSVGIPEGVYFPAELRGKDDIAVYYTGDTWRLKLIEMEPTESCLSVHVLAERKAGFYLWNVLVLNFCLVMSNSTVAGIHRSQLSDRVQVSITLMLSAIAFKFVLMQTIPVVSYLTLLDVYVITSFMWLFFSCLESYLAAKVLTDVADWYFNAIAAGLWVLMHVVIVVGYHFGFFSATLKQVREEQDKLTQELALSIQTVQRRAISVAPVGTPRSHARAPSVYTSYKSFGVDNNQSQRQ